MKSVRSNRVAGGCQRSSGSYRWWSKSGLPAGSLKAAPWQTPESNESRSNSTPAPSSVALAASTSSTPNAMQPPKVDSAIVRLPVSYSTQRSPDAFGFRARPSVSP
jgi:hypothetical protein